MWQHQVTPQHPALKDRCCASSLSATMPGGGPAGTDVRARHGATGEHNHPCLRVGPDCIDSLRPSSVRAHSSLSVQESHSAMQEVKAKLEKESASKAPPSFTGHNHWCLWSPPLPPSPDLSTPHHCRSSLQERLRQQVRRLEKKLKAPEKREEHLTASLEVSRCPTTSLIPHTPPCTG